MADANQRCIYSQLVLNFRLRRDPLLNLEAKCAPDQAVGN